MKSIREGLKFRETVKKIFVTGLCFSFLACSASQSGEIPYRKGTTFYFEATVDSAGKQIAHDTLVMEIKGKKFIGALLGLNFVQWSSKNIPDYSEKRGINISDNSVQIQTPLNVPYMEYENAVIAPYPSFSASTNVNSEITTTHRMALSYGKLGGKTFEQKAAVKDSTQCNYKEEQLSCKVREGHNASHQEKYGKYQSITHYHEDYGFVMIKFVYPNGKEIRLELVEILKEG